METKCKRCGVNNEYPSFHHCVVPEPTLRDKLSETDFGQVINIKALRAIEEFIASRDTALLEFIESKKKECANCFPSNEEERTECYGYDENYNSALDIIASHIKGKQHDL